MLYYTFDIWNCCGCPFGTFVHVQLTRKGGNESDEIDESKDAAKGEKKVEKGSVRLNKNEKG